MQVDLILNSLSKSFLKSKLLTIIFFGYLKNTLNIYLLRGLDDQPCGAVLDLVIISILKHEAKKIAYMFVNQIK